VDIHAMHAQMKARMEVHASVLEGMLRRGRTRLGRHEQQPRVSRRRDLRHAERRQHLHYGQAAEGQDQGRQGRATVDGHPPTATSTEVFTKYIITDMYAKAAQGMKAEDAVGVGGR
jgi:hypothetical protein